MSLPALPAFFRYTYSAPCGRSGTVVASTLAKARAKAYYKLIRGEGTLLDYSAGKVKLAKGVQVVIGAGIE